MAEIRLSDGLLGSVGSAATDCSYWAAGGGPVVVVEVEGSKIRLCQVGPISFSSIRRTNVLVVTKVLDKF